MWIVEPYGADRYRVRNTETGAYNHHLFGMRDLAEWDASERNWHESHPRRAA